jgi:oligopeptide/dipeptide ABC transporter ATP-binding protein
MNPPQPLLRVSHMQTHFHTFEGVAKAVDDVSFNCMPGETLGLVGESGSGKSVTALSIMQLIPTPPGRYAGGEVIFNQKNLLEISASEMRSIRGNRISMIFQEPMTSLNPVFTIGDQISEVFVNHEGLNTKQAMEQTVEMLHKVQIPSPRKRANEYPHQLSGGMRQRAMIAMALACKPQVLIADEPTTALDVTIQAQIIDLMMELKKDYQTSIIMITHDLGVIAQMADWVVVMYAGKVVEEARTVDLFENPVHPYTQGLLNSVPVLGRRSKKGRTRLKEISGVVPSLYELPKGCSFHPRCTQSMEVCIDRPPRTHELEKGHRVSCWLCESGHNSQDQAKDQGGQS